MKEEFLLNALISYALNNQLISKQKVDDAIEAYCQLFKVDRFHFEYIKEEKNFQSIINPLLEIAYEKELFYPNTIVEKDAFEAQLMDIIMPSPFEVKQEFKKRYEIQPQSATDYLFKLSNDVNYIKTLRLKENISWKYKSKYGELQLTINLAKPEKDPKDIAAAVNQKKEHDPNIPMCVLCKENEQNYHNARMNLRIVPIYLNKELWHFQYSPYQYYHEHAIVLHDQHRPMKISHLTFEYLLDFVDMFPQYFIGSNADLPIVGGSILNHDHFQAGKYKFPIEETHVISSYQYSKDLLIEHINWPLSTIRITSNSRAVISQMASHILNVWKVYDHKELDIISHTNGGSHQTITPILRKTDHQYVLNLVLRNNRTSSEYPDGIFHPHADVHHIKKENIGLIEAMGLAILPGRLKKELDLIEKYLNHEISYDQSLDKHQDWMSYLAHYDKITKEILFNEVGKKYERVLEDAGVYKLDEKGLEGMNRLINEIIKTSKIS